MNFEYRHITRFLSVACTLAASAGCGSEAASSHEPGLDEEVGVESSSLHKGTPGAQVGQRDYCDSPANLCASGEGDCDSIASCVSGLVCGSGKLAQFGFTLAGGDACVPPQCVNRRLDPGETQIDCGGPCGSVCATPVCAADGTANRCSTDCPCGPGQGDCDSNAQCTGTLVCSDDKLRQFGFSGGGDACLPAHCSNRVEDAGETQIDCGGPCGSVCTAPVCDANGTANRCSTDCLCGPGQGDCDSSAQCTGTLVCSNDKLKQFGFASGGDACLPAHCTNRVMDAGETRIDCGGECGTVCSPTSAVPLGAAGNYAILAESAISTVPTSAITGHVGLSPAAASYITGFSLTRVGTSWTSPQVVGSVFAADNDPPTPSNLTTAVANMHTAYTNAAGRPSPNFLNLGGGALGGRTLAPGLYRFTSAVTVSSGVTLSGGANDVWIFQITGNLLMSASQSMTLSGGAQAKNIFWQVAGLVDLGSGAHAEGIMLSKTAIKLGAGASINGRLLAQTQVNLSSSTVTQPAP